MSAGWVESRVCLHPIVYSGGMELRIATLGRHSLKRGPAEQLVAGYCERIDHFCRCRGEHYATEEKFLAAEGALGQPRGRTRPMLVLLDSRGKLFSSMELAEWLRLRREDGTQRLVFAIGPADGWSQAARERAGLLLSLGPLTLPHELAAVVLAEQIYRAFTIVEGHPYHLGHAGG